MVYLIILIISLIQLIYCDEIPIEEFPNYLKFPFNTKIKSFSKTKLDEEYNETNFINDFLNNTIFINMSIGTPQQTIKIMLDQNDNCFSFSRDKKLIKYNSDHLNNINYTQVTPYNKNLSLTAKRGQVTYYDFNTEFNDVYDMEDFFYLYQYSDSKNLTIKNSSSFLRFLYRNYKDDEEIIFGKIGLDMNNYEDSSCPRFFYSLGIKNPLKKYNYYFDFYSDFHGYFFLGPEPHLFNNLLKEYQYIQMNTILSKEGYIYWNLLFNKILLIDPLSGITFNLNEKMIQMDFNLGLIIGTYEYQQYIEENYFNNIIKENICKKCLVEYPYENNDKINKYYVYKCNKEFMNGGNFDKEKYKPYINYFEIFPDFQLFHINFEHNFYLTKYELFKLIQGDYYFLIIFEAEKQNKVWKFGQTFLKGHQLIFNYDSKIIGYYDRRIQPSKDDPEEPKKDNTTTNTDTDKNEINENNKNYNIYIYISIFIVFCIIVIIAFYLGMKVKESRKKRANELKDDDYDYMIDDNNNNINSNNKIINN